ncbi:12605_t:CDS:2, partial [Gigaspora rosea]
ADQIQSFQKKFYETIAIIKEQSYMKNSAAMSKYHEEWADKIWKDCDTDKFEEAIELFEQTYGTVVKPGHEAVQVLNSFKANQYKDAIELLKTYGNLREERVNEMLARQEAEKKYYELLQEEEKLK